MKILGLDVGSSSVKAGVVRDGRIIGRLARSAFPTQFDGLRAEVDPDEILAAIRRAIHDLGAPGRRADAVGLSVMSPCWVAMDARGRAITPLITHQDRRSFSIAKELERRVGKARHLRIAGNRPFPGSISSTTAAWFARHEPRVFRRADLLGHLNTFLIRQLTGERVIDPSNASFTGLYETCRQGGWSAELCAAVGVNARLLPRILESNAIAGHITQGAARHFGLTAGMPVMTGAVDTSCAMFLTGAPIGQLMNTSGSTDVLGLCAAKAHPHDLLLTRALGIGRKWMSVATLAAAGSAINWCRTQFFSEISEKRFYRLVGELASSETKSEVEFQPYLAGERSSMEQKRASFDGLTLATTRQDMLGAAIDALARASGARINLLRSLHAPMRRRVSTSGGSVRSLHAVLHRDWPGKWSFQYEDEASLRGVGGCQLSIASGG